MSDVHDTNDHTNTMSNIAIDFDMTSVDTNEDGSIVTSSFSFSSCDETESVYLDKINDCTIHYGSSVSVPVFESLSDDLIGQGIKTEEGWSHFYDPDTWNFADADTKPQALPSKLDTSPSDINIMNFPNDLLFQVISYLDLTSMHNVICTSKSWRNRLLQWTSAYTTTENMACTTTNNKDDDHMDDGRVACMNTIWLPRYYDKFSFLRQHVDNLVSKNGSNVVSSLLSVDDELDVSPVVLRSNTSAHGENISRRQKAINHPLLLSFAAENVPTGIDEKEVRSIQSHYERLQQQNNTHQRLHQWVPHIRRICKPTEIKLIEIAMMKSSPCDGKDLNTQPKTVIGVAFTGEVGNGDRCIRSDKPLPRPIIPSSTKTLKRSSSFDTINGINSTENRSEHDYQSSMSVGVLMLQDLVLRYQFETNAIRTILDQNVDQEGNQDQTNIANHFRQYQEQINRVLRLLSQQHSSENSDSGCYRNSHTCWKPFVAPFMMNSGAFCVSPRLVSYYEISIHSLPPSVGQDATESHTTPTVDINGRRARVQCIAIGLGARSFSLIDRMPGWDHNSIGYHGDDGGLFHGAGMMKRKIGPSFGVGDVVGCGMDYTCQSVFFTYNGAFLGYEPIRSDYLLHSDLYPIIGIDSNCVVSCNFGLKEPYQFDLLNHMKKSKSIIFKSIGLPEKTRFAASSSMINSKALRQAMVTTGSNAYDDDSSDSESL